MSNHISIRGILLHHRQVNAGRARKAEYAKRRRYVFELTRAGIKVKVEADRQYMAACALVFLMGFTAILGWLCYILGAIFDG